MLKEPIYGKYYKAITAIIISAFFIQDIAWSYPDPSLHDHSNNTKLAPASFDRRHTLEDKIATSIVFMIEQSHGIPLEKLTLDGVEAVLNKAEEFLAENKVGFLRNGKDITIYVSPNFVLRYTDSDSKSENLSGFTVAGPQKNLGALVRCVFAKAEKPSAPEQLKLNLTVPSLAKDSKAAKSAVANRPSVKYQSALKKLSKAYDKYIHALRMINWLRSPDRKYYRARAAKKIGGIKLAKDKADSEIVALLEKISAMDWRVYKISPDASNEERLECVSLNIKEIYIRLKKMMEDDGPLGLMTNLKDRLKETIVPLLAGYLNREAASSDGVAAERLPIIAKYTEPLEKHAEMMRTISKMKRGEDGLITEDGPSSGHGAISVKAREEIFVIGEKCLEIARQLKLLDRSDETKIVIETKPQPRHYNKIISKLIPAEEFADVAAEEIAHRIVSYQNVIKGNINLVLAQSGMTAEFLENLANEPDIDWPRVNILALSGRTGISQESVSSFRNFIEKHLSDNLPEDEEIRSTNIYEISDENIEQYKKSLQGNLRPHVVVLTPGTNGEIGYNGPGTPFESTVHDVKLTDEAGNNITARTLGISEISSALSIFLLARPEDKDIMVNALFGPVTTDIPASVLQTENIAENVTVLLSDEPAPPWRLRPGPSGGVDLPKRWTADALEISRDADDKGRIIITIPGYSTDRFTLGANYAFHHMILKPLKSNWSKGFEVYYEDKLIGVCDPVSGEFNPAEIRRPTDYKGRFSITISGYKTNRFNLGAEHGLSDVTLVSYPNDDWATGFMVNVNGEAVAAYDAANNVFGLFEEARALDEKGRFSVDKVRYTLGTDNTSKYSGEKIILRPYKGFDWDSGFVVYCNGSRIAYYDKETNIMAGMYVAEKSFSEDSERLAALHDLFTIESKDRHIKDGTRILLSESLFTNGADENELIQVRIVLSSVLDSGYITIMKPEDIRIAAMNQNVSKDKLAIVLTKEDFNNEEIWKRSDKETSLKSSVLILDDKFTGNNYLYLEGAIGLAQALMANNRQAIRAYYELISGADIGDEIMALLYDDSQNNVAFAVKAVLRFRPITRIDSGGLNEKRINMENALIAA